MLPTKYLKLIEEEGVSLIEAGVDEIGLKRQSALRAIRSLEGTDIAILGGDVYELVNGKPKLTYDNWYCEQDSYSGFDEFLNASWKIAESYILNYKEPENKIILYSLVLSMGGHEGDAV